MLTKDGRQLEKLIKKAIEDHQITTKEFDEIHHLASQDGHIDHHESILLKQLHDMIADNAIKRVP